MTATGNIMSSIPAIPFIGVAIAIGSFLAIGLATFTLIESISLIVDHIADGELSQEDRGKLQESQSKLDEYLKSLFDFQANPGFPQSDILVPSSNSTAYRIPIKIGGLQGGGNQGQEWYRYIWCPPLIVRGPNGNIIFRLPPGWKKLPGPPPPSDVPTYCGPPWKPWFPGQGPDPDDGSGSAGSLPVCAAAGHHLERPGIVFNRGRAGGISIRDWTSQGVFHVRKFQRSGTVNIENETDDILIIGDPFSQSAVEASGTYSTHGGPIATSMYCFPGQSIQIGGVSTGAGIEAYFRIQVWQVPRSFDVDHELLNHLKSKDNSLEIYMLQPGPSKLVANLWAFVDVPWAGSNKINVFETGPEEVYNFPGDCGKLTADYKKVQDLDHDTEGPRYRMKFRLPKGENPVGWAKIMKK